MIIVMIMIVNFINPLSQEGGGRLWRIVLLKVAYYATSRAQNLAKLC